MGLRIELEEPHTPELQKLDDYPITHKYLRSIWKT